jgi:type II secretory pathway component GspD/PulD (secretin)
MKKLLMIRMGAAALFLTGLVITTSVRGDTSKVSSLKVEKQSGSSSFVISKLGDVEVEEFMMKDPPRLVVDFIGAAHALAQNQFEGDGQFVNQVRTSQFTNEPNKITRVVFDLIGDVSHKIVDTDDAVTIQFFAKDSPAPADWTPGMNPTVDKAMNSTPVTPRTMAGSMVPSAIDEMPSVKPAPPQTSSATQSTSTPKPAWTSPTTATQSSAAESWESSSATQPSTPSTASTQPSSASTASTPTMTAWNQPARPQESAAPSMMPSSTQNLQSLAQSAGLVRNKNITIDVQNADVKTVLRSMSEFSGTNIISGPEVEGKVTAHLKNVPWRQALDIILKAHGFGWREEYGVIRVSTLEKLTKEELELQAAERKKDDLLPLESAIVPLSFANAGEMKDALKDMLSSRGHLEVEKGNNSLIITDIAKNVEKISSMVTDLDRKIKQVEIVAKLVDVDYEASREMGVRWDLLNVSLKNVNAVGDAVIDAQSSQPVGTFRVGTVQSWGQVQGIVDMLAKENKANIISNPRIVTADNREASILVGKEIPLIVQDQAGNPITELTKVGIVLRVTPHVNLDKTITMDLHPEVSELSAQATVQGGVIISLSEADTRVVVGDGETAVIGGLINEVESSLENGVPVLMDLPFVGNFFKLKNKTHKKRELIIFVTPRIVDYAGKS